MPSTEDPRRQRRRLRGYAALASAASLTAMTAALAAGGPPAQAATPDAISSYTAVTGVSARSATDAWTVGWYENSSNVEEPLTEHWNGTAWKTVKSPAPSGAKGATLQGVSADSARNAWAAGYYENSSSVYESLILQWNGTAWKTVKTPAPSGAQEAILQGVSADSATSAWAVGHYLNRSGIQEPLVLHWNGTAWKTVTTSLPSGAGNTFLTGVSADSATDAWAAGYYLNSSGTQEPLVLHWNGTAWKTAKTAALSGATDITLNGISADSATSAWTVGYYTNSSNLNVPLTEHWNGTAWKTVKAPAPSGARPGFTLTAVSADSAASAWAVGQYTNSSNVVVPLTEHWNGTAWKTVPSPAPASTAEGGLLLTGVSADSATDAWAVGQYDNSSGELVTLTLHWTGAKWKAVKSPDGT